MRVISDQKQIQKYIRSFKIHNFFDTKNLEFLLFIYEKGELLTSQNTVTDYLYFLIQGSVKIYGIRNDGSMIPVNNMHAPIIIGDFEFSNLGLSPFYAEAADTCICIGVSVKQNKEKLDHDVTFLHCLLTSYADKLRMFNFIDSSAQSLEEKVIRYLSHIAPQKEINGTEKTALALRCSRRQLQRVLKKLCDENKLEKIGRGHYRLKNESADPAKNGL